MYVFDEADNYKLDALVKYIKDTYPDAVVVLVKDKSGFTSATITQFSNEATADCGAPPCFENW